MQVDRYIRAFHKQTVALAFAVQLPPDALTFLSTLDFLTANNDDVNLYCVYDLTKEQANLIFGYYHLLYEADTDYFDYFLDCDAKPEKPVVKTKEELLNSNLGSYLEDLLSFMVHDISGISDRITPKHALADIKDHMYKIYQQGVVDGQL